MSEQQLLEQVRSALGFYPDFPKAGITFVDVFGVMADKANLDALLELLRIRSEQMRGQFDVVVGLDARGFLFGPIMAKHMGAAFVPVRKKGKLPGECASVTYELEYGTDTLQLQKHAMGPEAKRVLIVDDLLATGGTMAAAVQLVQGLGKTVERAFVIIELNGLGARAKVEKLGVKVDSLFLV